MSVSVFERAARWLFWPALMLSLVMALLPKPPATPIDSLGDKFAHALAFCALTVLAQIGFGRGQRWRLALLLSLFGAAIEVAQLVKVLHRDAEVMDWVVDSAVVLAVTLVFVGIDRLQTRAFALGREGR